MPNELDPIVDQWYAHRDKGETFQVVAMDAASGSVEIQSFDGDVEEVDAGAWRGMDIETTEPPEDWTGPYDDVEIDDLGMTETDMSTQDWRSSLDPVQPPEEPWQDARPPDELEEEEEGRPIELYAQEVKPADDPAP